ncbi:hypothetical protein DICA3_A05336 [Diutina catenulata]
MLRGRTPAGASWHWDDGCTGDRVGSGVDRPVVRPFLYVALPVSSPTVHREVCEHLAEIHGDDRARCCERVAALVGLSPAEMAAELEQLSPVAAVLRVLSSPARGSRQSVPSAASAARKQAFLERFPGVPVPEVASALYDVVAGDERRFLTGMAMVLNERMRAPAVEDEPSRYSEVMANLQRDIKSIEDTPRSEDTSKSEDTPKSEEKVASEPVAKAKKKKPSKAAQKRQAKKQARREAKAGEAGTEREAETGMERESTTEPETGPSDMEPSSSEASSKTTTSTTNSAAESSTADSTTADSTNTSAESATTTANSTTANSTTDHDPDFDAVCDSLADLFPHVARSELALLIQTSTNMEELVEYLCVDQETHDLAMAADEAAVAAATPPRPPGFPEEVHFLKGMFPAFAMDSLQRALDGHHGDIEATSDFLLSDPDAAAFAQLASPPSDAARLQQWLRVDAATATRYLEHKHHDFAAALVALLLDHRPSAGSKHIPSGGRVQRGQTTRGAYSYFKSSPEARELASIHTANPQLRDHYHPEFMATALVFFRGNVDAVMSLCMAALGDDVAADINTRFCLDAPGVSASPAPSMAAALKTRVPSQPRAKPQANTVMTRHYDNYQRHQTSRLPADAAAALAQFRRGGTLDLHGLLLQPAMSIARTALAEWWSSELKARETQGELHKFGARAQFAGSVNIVTGRGLHSAGGVSVIRRGIANLLKIGRYTYDEEAGSFEVTGKLRG